MDYSDSVVSSKKRKADIKFDPDSKILECMVCGKKFSRGIVDLTRHQQAITLKHLFTASKTSLCTLPCNDCGIFFSTPEHLELHQAQSSCPKKKNGVKESPPKKKIACPSEGKFAVGDDTVPQNLVQDEKIIEIVNPTIHQDAVVTPPISSSSLNDLSSRKAKKGKVLIPEERKAFYAILSVLVKPLLPATGDLPKFDTENIFQFVPEKYAGLVDKLKDTLLYDCE